jgi:hypothetical protein
MMEWVPIRHPPVVARETPTRSILSDGTLPNIVDEMEQVSIKYSPAAVRLFRRALLFPRLFAVRAVEEAEIQQHILRLSVSMTLTVRNAPKDGQERGRSSLILPIMQVKKGVLIDILDTQDINGASLPVLSQSEVRGFIGRIVSQLYCQVYVGRRSYDLRNLSAQDLAPLYLVLAVIDQMERIDDKELRTVIKLLNTQLKSLEQSEDLTPERKALGKFLIQIVEYFAHHYVLAVEVPWPTEHYVILKYKKSLPIYAQANSIRDRWRLRLGLRPYRFTIPLWLPYFYQSYHFRMIATPGQHVGSHFLLQLPSGSQEFSNGGTDVPSGNEQVRVLQPEDFQGTKDHLQIHTQSGLPYAHLYTRNFHLRGAANWATVVHFFETPPGALGSAAAIALVTALLITFSGLIGPLPNEGSGIFSVLLASPALIASYVGLQADSESLLRTSLVSRIGLIFSTGLAVASAVLYVAQSRKALLTPLWEISFLGQTVTLHISIWWLVLSLLSWGLAAFLLGTLVDRGRIYMSDIQRADYPENPHAAEQPVGVSK